MKPTYERCPYTLQKLTDIEKVNDEHIFPDAIGGVKDYCLRVDEKAKSDLGTKIDAPLIDSFLMGLLRIQHGIKSRSGAPKLKMNGVLKDTERKVQVVISEDEKFVVRIHTPVEMNEDGDQGKLVLSPEESSSFLETFIKNHAKKGHKVVVSAQSTQKISEVEIPIEFDLLALKRAMLKIAYLAVYKYIGDAFLDDPLVPEWRKSFMADNPDDAKSARIYGVAFDSADLLNLILPPLHPHEHAVVVTNLQQQGPVVAVSLFGTSFHSLIAIASETSHFGMNVGEGMISICDTKCGKTRFINFQDHLTQM